MHLSRALGCARFLPNAGAHLAHQMGWKKPAVQASAVQMFLAMPNASMCPDSSGSVQKYFACIIAMQAYFWRLL